jgi:4-amino-4-deoxy-L-arabinose transferase-like glycosyltransferase
MLLTLFRLFFFLKKTNVIIGAVVGTGVFVLIGKLHMVDYACASFLVLAWCIVYKMRKDLCFLCVSLFFSTFDWSSAFSLPSGRLAEE